MGRGYAGVGRGGSFSNFMFEIYIYIQVLIIFSFVLITSSCFCDGSLLPFGILGCFMCGFFFFILGLNSADAYSCALQSKILVCIAYPPVSCFSLPLVLNNCITASDA